MVIVARNEVGAVAWTDAAVMVRPLAVGSVVELDEQAARRSARAERGRDIA
jgi:hypothetical protein